METVNEQFGIRSLLIISLHMCTTESPQGVYSGAEFGGPSH